MVKGILNSIAKLVEDILARRKGCTYLVISEVLYSQLRRDYLGLEFVLDNLDHHLDKFCICGAELKIIRMDEDYEAILLVG